MNKDETFDKYISDISKLDISFIESNGTWFKGGIGNLDYPSCFVEEARIIDEPQHSSQFDIYKRISYKVIIHPHFFPFVFPILLSHFDDMDEYCKVKLEKSGYYCCRFHRTISKEKHSNTCYPTAAYIEQKIHQIKKITIFPYRLRKIHNFLRSKDWIFFILSLILTGLLCKTFRAYDWPIAFGIASFIIFCMQENFSKIEKTHKYEYGSGYRYYFPTSITRIHREYICRTVDYLSIILPISQIVALIILLLK